MGGVLGKSLYEDDADDPLPMPPAVDHDELHELSDGGIEEVGLQMATGWILAACTRS